MLNKMRLFYANILKGRQYLLCGVNMAKILKGIIRYFDYLFGLVIFEYFHSNGMFVFFHSPTLVVCLLVFGILLNFSNSFNGI